ncbi:MAG: protein of unknown function with transmembrane region [Candidatus Campbellbacteria bacterium GW2011_OD1_34_28]|nr:MAG: protein of unknown function with transmembrane region [Candidatus Campbellbacteria bacterium GW2011_OD1_34_28]
MDIEKAYSTHEIGRGPKNLKLFLARNRHGLEAIHYSTFYYAGSNTYILSLAFSFARPRIIRLPFLLFINSTVSLPGKTGTPSFGRAIKIL